MTPHTRLALLLAVALLFLPACGSKKTADPAAVQAFVAQYETAYQANDREGILNQVDWPAVDEALREYTKEYVFPYRGQVALVSIVSVPYEPSPDDPQDFEGKPIVPSPAPSHRMVLTFEPPNPYAEPRTLERLIVEREGKVQLCGWSFAD